MLANIKKIFLLIIFILILSHGIYKLYQYSQPSFFENKTIVTIPGVIVDIPHLNDRVLSFMFKTDQGLVKLNWYQQKLMLTPGQKWQLKIKLKHLEYFANPGEFNYGKYLHQQGIQGLGYVLNGPEDQLLDFKWYNAPLDYLRFCWYQKLLDATANLKTQAILVALILGDKSLLNTVDWQSFERTGTSYFMVISGLHIVLFAALGAILARFLWALIPRFSLKIPAPQVGLAVGLVLGLIYGLMAGALVPTQRAVLMLLLVGIAKFFFKALSSIRALIISFILIILWNPLVIFSVAFWMSFVAVFFLIFCFSGRMRKLKWWQEWTLPQWLMFWVLLPVIIYTFNQFATIAIFTNLLTMPFMMLGVIPTALLGAFLIWPLPTLGILCLQLSNFIMEQLLYVLHYFAFKTWWGTWIAQISFINMLFGLLGALIIFLPKGIPGRYFGWCMFIPIMFPLTTNTQLLQTTELKTMNGTAFITQIQHHIILEATITNMRAAHSDLKHIIEAYCIHEGIDHIDLWVINTHGNYHNILDLVQDMPKLKIAKIASNHKFTIYDSRFIFCGKATPWTWGKVKFNLTQNKDKQCVLIHHVE